MLVQGRNTARAAVEYIVLVGSNKSHAIATPTASAIASHVVSAIIVFYMQWSIGHYTVAGSIPCSSRLESGQYWTAVVGGTVAPMIDYARPSVGFIKRPCT